MAFVLKFLITCDSVVNLKKFRDFTFLIATLLLLNPPIFGQANTSRNTEPLQKTDTLNSQVSEIALPEIKLFKKLKFRREKEKLFYYWYKEKTLNAYPFAVIAAKELSEVQKNLDSLKTRRSKRRHTREVHKTMKNEFEDQLKQLTRTEGRILIKLIHRQTGETAYKLIKNYRSRWRAYLYQRVAKFHKVSLKDTYQPESNIKDYIIEDILQRAFLEEIIEEQPSKLDFDYLELSKKYRRFIH